MSFFVNKSCGISCLGSPGFFDKGFVKVNNEYNFNIAQKYSLAKVPIKKHFLLLTGFGSNQNSKLWFMKTKGKTEEACKGLQFDKLSIFRPMFLVLDESEKRTNARYAESFARSLIGVIGNPHLISVKSRDVADFMAKCAVKKEDVGLKIYENYDIHSGKV